MPKVNRFTDAQGIRHLPGEVVDLPASYDGESWLERVDPEPKFKVSAAKVEVPAQPVAVPLEAAKPKKPRRKAV